jgi:hypothetical protein
LFAVFHWKVKCNQEKGMSLVFIGNEDISLQCHVMFLYQN